MNDTEAGNPELLDGLKTLRWAAKAVSDLAHALNVGTGGGPAGELLADKFSDLYQEINKAGGILAKSDEEGSGFCAREWPESKPTEEEHTPGPWTVFDHPSGKQYVLGSPGSMPVALVLREIICECDRPKHQAHVQSQANARLIAAAPELLGKGKKTEACVLTVASLWGQRHHEAAGPALQRALDDLWLVTAELRETIAKAEGK